MKPGASTRDTLRAGARASSHTHADGATAATATGGLICVDHLDPVRAYGPPW